MKINKTNIVIIILIVIDSLIGFLVVNKCIFKHEIENDVKSEAKIVDELERVESNVEGLKIVYDGMTLDELAEKLDKVLTSTLEGTGIIYATKSIELGVDPYVAVAISMHETGCKWGCSKLVRECYNVGGMKGKPGCNGGSYIKFGTLEEGITKFIENLYRNYYAYGLTTPETMNPKYAADPEWAVKVNKYINNIKKI